MHRSDTDPDIQKLYDERVGRLSEEERFSRGLSLTHFCRELCLSGIREREPDLEESELKVRFFEVAYGEDFPPDERQRIVKFLRKREG